MITCSREEVWRRGRVGLFFFFCFSVELKGEINEQHVC